MKIQIIAFLLIGTLSGCAAFQGNAKLASTAKHNRSGVMVDKKGDNQVEPSVESAAEPIDRPYQASLDFTQRYQQKLRANMPKDPQANSNTVLSSKNINDYVRGMMQDLVANLQYVNQSTPMAVTSFVNLQSDFATSNVVGNQLAESFVHEVHKFGIPVVDYKATDFIRVTPQGDFILSRDFSELKANLPIKYVLTGTLVEQQDGMLVNARIVGISSKAVVASAQGFLPAQIVDALLNQSIIDNIQLVKE